MHYCGRTFTVPEIELIRALIASDPPPSRYQLSRTVCEHLGWRRQDGHLKDMSCRVVLLRMQADGLLTLPEPRRKRPGVFMLTADLDSRVCPPPFTTRVDLDRISIEPVAQRGDSRLWNAYIERHHYLGHELVPGTAALLRALRWGHTRAAILRSERLEDQTARCIHRLERCTPAREAASDRQQRSLPDSPLGQLS